MRIVCAYGSPVNSRAPVPMSLLRTLRRGTSGACTSRHATEAPGRRNRAREGRAGRDPGIGAAQLARCDPHPRGRSCSLWAEGPLTDSAAYLRANPSLSQEDLSFERLRTRTDFGSPGADAP